MIKVTETNRTIREATAKFSYAGANGVETSDIRVLFYSLTTKELKDLRAETRRKLEANEAVWHSESLIDELHGLPDLVDENEKPLFVPHGGDPETRAASLAFLDSLENQNIKSIRDAIDEAISPKAQPEK